MKRQLVALGDILASRGGHARPRTRSRSRIGRDIDGRAVMANLAQMPHILIAGATGAGKSCASTRSSRRSSCARRPIRCA